MNGKDLARFKQFCDENKCKLDIIMTVLHLVGFDDRVIDYLSDGFWSKKQALIGADLSEFYPIKKVEEATVILGKEFEIPTNYARRRMLDF